MTVDHIETCVCIDHEPTGADSVYYGMPILMPTDSWDTHKSFWEIKCPKCGRGGMYQFKSPYYALKWWNELQKRLKNPINPITGVKEDKCARQY